MLESVLSAFTFGYKQPLALYIVMSGKYVGMSNDGSVTIEIQENCTHWHCQTFQYTRQTKEVSHKKRKSLSHYTDKKLLHTEYVSKYF